MAKAFTSGSKQKTDRVNRCRSLPSVGSFPPEWRVNPKLWAFRGACKHPVVSSGAKSGGADGGAKHDRERDARGRARNARPRDALGRPLPRGSSGIPTTPDELVLTPGQALDEAQRLVDAGRPFHAHEVLEGIWKASPDVERDLWRGLAQLAVGLTHLMRENYPGATALLIRGRDRISDYEQQSPSGIDVPGLVAWANATVAAIAESEASADQSWATKPHIEVPHFRRLSPE